MAQVSIEKLREVFGGDGEPMRGEHFPADDGVRAASDLDFGQIVIDAKAIPETEADGFLAGASGSDERAVDIEKEEFLVQAPKLSARGIEAQAKPVAAGGFR
jgi:hypothetical protein